MTHAMSVPAARSTNLMPLYVIGFCLLWSASFVAGKIGVTECPPLVLLTVRFLAAGILVLGFAAIRGGEWNLSRRDVLVFAVIGVANNALYLGLGYIGLKTISAGLNALIVSANPVFVAVLAAVFLGEQITWQKVVGLLLGVAGVALIVAHRMSAGTDSPIGIAFSVGALVSIVAGTILFKVLEPKGSLLVGNGIQNMSGGLVLLPFALMFSNFSEVVPSGRLLLALGYLVVFGSIIAFVLWFHLLTTIGATAASAYHFLMPPLGMLFGWMILGEHVAAFDLLGVLPVALGIYLVTRPIAASVQRSD
ncbi:DMT family transporter [Bradyrhizobium sp. SYSU BS000235]|uniref:DMT family transporter n=1 Tax=Bradyrhizobium sp. SYSU BS000235 TaxID=3411332 RepID=UPI003C767694